MSNEPRLNIRRAQLLLLLTATIWASNYPIAKYALSQMNALVFNGFRFITAAAVLSLIIVSRGEWISVARADWRNILRVGIVASVLYQCAFIVGLNLTTAGNAAVIMATSPLWTLFINARLHKEKIQPQMWLGIALSLFGILLIIAGSGKKLSLGGFEIIGDLICVAASMFWALNTNMQKPLLARYSPLHLATLSVAIGAVGLSLVAIPNAVTANWSSFGWNVWLAVLVSGGLSIGIANVFWSNGVQQLGPGKTAPFSNLIPVIAFALSYFVLNENVNTMQIIGSAITIAGVWLARR
jgi:drug/metabolite transporter (DMT)-like permease